MALAAVGGGYRPLTPEQQALVNQLSGGPNITRSSSPLPAAADPTVPFQANPNLWNNQDMPVTQWSSLAGSGGGGMVNGAGQAIPAVANPAAPAPALGGGSDIASLLNNILGQVQSYNPADSINSAFQARGDQAAKAAGLQAQTAQGARGLLPSDPAAQALHSELLTDMMSKLGAEQASALAGAQQSKLNMLAGLIPGFASLQSQQLAQQQRAADQAEDQRRYNQEWQHRLDLEKEQKAQQTLANGGGGSFQTPTPGGTATTYVQPSTASQAVGQGLGLQGQAPVVNTGTSNNGESFADTMARLGQGGGGGFADGSGVGGVARYVGTVNGGSTAGLDANGNWQKPSSYSSNTGASNTGTASPGYAQGPSSAPSPGAMNPGGQLWSQLKAEPSSAPIFGPKKVSW